MEVLGTDRQQQWLQVLEQAVRHDWYHLPQYHHMTQESGAGEGALFVYREGKDFIALPLLLRPMNQVEGLKGSPWMDAASVYGYAGPIASDWRLPDSLRRNFHEALRHELKERKVVSVFSRMHPFLHQQELLEGIGECVPVQETVSIDLKLQPAQQQAQYRKEYLQAIAKAKAQGLTCEEVVLEEGLEEFIGVYQHTMGRKNAAAHLCHGRPYFEALKEALGAQLHLFAVRLGSKMICAGLFTHWDGIVQYHLSGSLSEYMKLAPAKLLLNSVRLWATGKGYGILHLGGGTAPGAENSLFRFKAGFSKERHVFRVWQWVVQEEVYAQVCRQRNEWRFRHGLEMQPNFFPEYRSVLYKPEVKQ